MTHVQPELGAYVLGALDPAEAERVRAHVEGCSDCAAAHAELSELPGLLDLAVVAGAAEEDPLPPAIEERVLDRFARERPRAEKRRRLRPRLAVAGGGVALAGAAVAAAVIILGFGFARPEESRFILPLQPAAGAPVSVRGHAGLRQVDGGTALRLSVANLPHADGDVYEVLCGAKDWTASAGTFRVDAHGNANVLLTTAARRGQYDWIRIVRRTPGATEPQDVLGAKLS